MFENALSPNNTRLLQDVPCALIPAEFARAWRQYTYRPLKFPRPGGLDTTCFVCEHNQLNIDPNSNDLDTSICVIRKDDWNTLNELYPVTGPLVEVVRREVPDEQNELHSSFVHDIPVCEDCRRTRCHCLTSPTLFLLTYPPMYVGNQTSTSQRSLSASWAPMIPTQHQRRLLAVFLRPVSP